MKYYYVDTKEVRKTPKPGPQWVAWYMGRSMRNPGGQEFTDVINGEEVCLRAIDEVDLKNFLKMAYTRAPYIKPHYIVEGDE